MVAPPNDHRHEVVITVDRQPHTVPVGRHLVADLKKLVGVTADRELDELKKGALVPLDDSGHITIHGGEVFISHVLTGGSA